MLINELASQLEASSTAALASRRKLRSMKMVIVLLALLLFGAAIGAGSLLMAAKLGIAALGCVAFSALLTLLEGRNALGIQTQMQNLAALRSIARDIGATPAEIAATDAVYRSLNTREIVEIMRGRNSII